MESDVSATALAVACVLWKKRKVWHAEIVDGENIYLLVLLRDQEGDISSLTCTFSDSDRAKLP
ncbi:MAG: hypothetical protein ACRDL7_11410 [Gaiellaceae bacterium]